MFLCPRQLSRRSGLTIIDCHYHLEQRLLPVAAELAKIGEPLLIHAGFDAYGDYEALLGEVPDLKLILAHAGSPAPAFRCKI